MNKEFIKFYVETAKNKHPFNSTDWELKERGFIKKFDINFLGTSDRYDDCYFTRISNIDETLYVKKADFDEVEDDPDPRHKKLSQDDLDHWKQVYDYQMETLKATPITKEAIDKAFENFEIFKTIKDCIDLLSTDGKGTKQQVKERLEELLK